MEKPIHVLIGNKYDVDDESIINGNLCKYVQDYRHYYLDYFSKLELSGPKEYKIINNILPLFISQYNIYYSEESIHLKNFTHNGYIIANGDIILESSNIIGIIFSINGEITIKNSNIKFNIYSFKISDNASSSESSSSSDGDGERDSDEETKNELGILISKIEEYEKKANILSIDSDTLEDPLQEKIEKKVGEKVRIFSIDELKCTNYENALLFLNCFTIGLYNLYVCKFADYTIHINVNIGYNAKLEEKYVKVIYVSIKKGKEKKVFSINYNKSFQYRFYDLTIKAKNKKFEFSSSNVSNTTNTSFKISPINSIDHHSSSGLSLEKTKWKYVSYINKSNEIIYLNKNEMFFPKSGFYRFIQWKSGAVNIGLFNSSVSMLSIQSYHNDKKFNEKWQWIGNNVLRNNIMVSSNSINDICLATNHNCTLRIQGDGTIIFMTSGYTGLSGIITGNLIPVININDYRFIQI